jgi:hypothetical protein
VDSKAILVSLSDYQKLLQVEQGQSTRAEWLAKRSSRTDQAAAKNLPVDVDALLNADRTELEERHA